MTAVFGILIFIVVCAWLLVDEQKVLMKAIKEEYDVKMRQNVATYFEKRR